MPYRPHWQHYFPTRMLQKAALNLLSNTFQKRDFAQPISIRASRVLGPISRHHVAQIIPVVRTAAGASRPGLAVGLLRVLCNGMCATKRFHIDNEEHSCRMGCPNGPNASPITTDVPSSPTFSARCGGTLSSTFVKVIYYRVSSLRYCTEAYSTGSRSWVLLMFLCTPTIIIDRRWTTHEDLRIAWIEEFGL